jgi:hypothetical protein
MERMMRIMNTGKYLITVCIVFISLSACTGQNDGVVVPNEQVHPSPTLQLPTVPPPTFTLVPTSTVTNTFPIGEYKGVSGRIINFSPDGTYTFRSTGGDLIIKNASYSVEGNILKLDDGNEDVCLGFEGDYEWSLGSEGIINLKYMSERCGGRMPPLIPSLTPVR